MKITRSINISINEMTDKKKKQLVSCYQSGI